MVDENGETIPCDLMTALLVPYFLEKKPQSAIVYDLRSSRVVMEEIIRSGGTPRRERVGHSYMKKAMRDTHAVFGGELSGHFYFEQNFYADSAAITLMHTLNVIDEKGKPISELIKPLRRYHSSGEINFKVDNKEAADGGAGPPLQRRQDRPSRRRHGGFQGLVVQLPAEQHRAAAAAERRGQDEGSAQREAQGDRAAAWDAGVGEAARMSPRLSAMRS